MPNLTKGPRRESARQQQDESELLCHAALPTQAGRLLTHLCVRQAVAAQGHKEPQQHADLVRPVDHHVGDHVPVSHPPAEPWPPTRLRQHALGKPGL